MNYAVRWDNPELEYEQAEARALKEAHFSHCIPFLAVLDSMDFPDKHLNDMCAELSRLIEAKWVEIKLRGDL